MRTRLAEAHFGLAKRSDTSGEVESVAETAAAPEHLTSPGTALGTVAYMSPEQVVGKPTDPRTDLFSLGVVLYEMVTGALPFKGEASGAMFDEILHKDPTPPTRLNPELPDELGRVVGKCLEKDRDLRYQSAAELRADLKRLRRDTTTGESVARPGVRIGTRRRRLLPWAAAGVLVVGGVVAGWLLLHRSTEPPAGPLKIMPFTSDGGSKWNPRLSPDGEKVAYNWGGPADDNADIYVKALGVGARALRLTENPAPDINPVWSPDGRQIAFDSIEEGDWNIYIIDADGGRPRRLTPEPSSDNKAAWSPDGRFIYFSSDRSGQTEIWKMPPDGGEAVQVTGNGGVYAEVSGDGQLVYYSKEGGGIWRMPVAGGEEAELVPKSIRWANWALARSGVYFMISGGSGSSTQYTIRHLDPATGQVKDLYRDEGRFWRHWLSVSPDETWILYSQAPPWTSELMLVENFR